jgi:hypothetical protein
VVAFVVFGDSVLVVVFLAVGGAVVVVRQFLFFVLFAVGDLATPAKSEAVLPPSPRTATRPNGSALSAMRVALIPDGPAR